jgi:hypothetical protein
MNMQLTPNNQPSFPQHPAAEPPGTLRNDESGWLGAPWGVTMPVPFEALPPSEPFKESLRGLAVREVKEPEIFRLFFDVKPSVY